MYTSFAERSQHASSYRAEILGAIAAQLILRAVTRNLPREYQEVLVYCDNRGVLNHGRKAEKDLKEKQAQFDVLYVMKGLILDSPVTSLFRWVEGHLVKKKGLHNCTEPEIMNDFVDKLAGMEYHRAVASCDFIGTGFPFEKL